MKILCFLFLLLTASGFSQQAIPASGGTVSGASGSFSISVGQAAYGYYKNATHSVSQGVQQTYAAYVTQVKSAQCGTVLANLDTAIVADTIVGAQKYRFEVTTASNVRTLDSTTNSFSLAQLSGSACFNTAYAIRVAVQYNAIWYDYGSSCTVTTPNNVPTAAAQTFCSGATVGNLTANGTAIKWYADAIGGTALSTTTLTSATYYASQTVNGCESARTAVAVTVFPKTTPTFAQIAAVCSGATIAALPITSTNAVTGTWAPALNNLATTTYTFTPTAELCANTTTITITVNPNVTPTFTAIAPICSGASLSPLPATSINNITGMWSPAINNAATTLYTFTPTAGTCANTVAMTITVNPKTTPTFTQVAAVCSGATISALPTTSTNSVTGTWSPAISNTATTTYIFTPTTGQCANTTTQTITITAPKVTSAISFMAPVAALPSVTIGTQVWTNKNLDVTTYRDGTPIPQVTDPTAWANLTTGAWCYVNNDFANGAIYGKLYNWYAVAGIHDNDPNTPNKTLSPQGWHIPTNAEWTTLFTFLGGESVAGGKMKYTLLWQSPNTGATNESGFTGLPGGYRDNDGTFSSFTGYAYIWSSTISSTTAPISTYAWSIHLGRNYGNTSLTQFSQAGGYSVRCTKD